VEIYVATFETPPVAPPAAFQDGNVATLPAQVWAPPTPMLSMPGVRPETFEVLVFHDDGGARLVGAIELASPANKDRPDQRRAFAVKCASYLYQGISLILIDIVTNRQANLHNEIVRVMESAPDFLLGPACSLYAVAYRPVRRQQQDVIDLWPTSLSLNGPLPRVPLYLSGELCLSVDLEATYLETCSRLKLA